MKHKKRKKKSIHVKDNLIHIKLEYEEALNGKRDMLAAEMGLLRVAERIERYKHYRDREIELKMILYQKTKELRANLTLLHKVLPKVVLPDRLKKKEAYKGQERIKEHLEKEKPISPMHEKVKSSVEAQLHEIERKLNRLQRT